MLLSRHETTVPKTLRIPETGRYVYSEQYKIEIKEAIVDSNFAIPTNSNHIVVDKAAVHFPLTLRRIKVADRFHPFGMRGTKLISDYLTNLKIDTISKRQQLVLVDGNGEIIWVVGRRSSDIYRISKSTTTALHIRFISAEEANK